MFRSILLSIVLAATIAATPILAETCIDQVPTLTGNTSAVSTSGDFSSSYRGWEAFDAQANASSMWISETWETPAWIAYDFGSNRVINRYVINNTNGSLTSRAPKDFTFQGWNGLLWVTLDTRTNETGWVSGQERTYNVQTPGSYSKYRLHITDDNDTRAGVVVISIGDLRFERCFCLNATDRVPTLTGNTSAVSTSGVFSGSYPAWKAFDGNVSSSSMWISETWETPAWIAYDFGTDHLITKYTLRNANGSLTSRAPKDFTLQGWNGSAWITVDSRTNETGWVSGTPRSYSVATPGYFSKYRLHVTDDNDSRPGVVVISLSDLQFQGCPTLVVPDLDVTLQCLSTITGDEHVCLATASGGSGGYQYAWSYFGDGFMQPFGDTADVSIGFCSGGTNQITVTATDSSAATASASRLLQCTPGCGNLICED